MNFRFPFVSRDGGKTIEHSDADGAKHLPRTQGLTDGLALVIQGGKWAAQAISGISVSSVFGRTGAVVAQTGDYTAAQVGALGATAQAVDSANLEGHPASYFQVAGAGLALGETSSTAYRGDRGAEAYETALLAEPGLGTPSVTSFLRSTAAGVRAWVQLVAADITDLGTVLAGYLTKNDPTFTGRLSGPLAKFGGSGGLVPSAAQPLGVRTESDNCLIRSDTGASNKTAGFLASSPNGAWQFGIRDDTNSGCPVGAWAINNATTVRVWGTAAGMWIRGSLDVNGAITAGPIDANGAISQAGAARITAGGEGRFDGLRVAGIAAGSLAKIADANGQLAAAVANTDYLPVSSPAYTGALKQSATEVITSARRFKGTGADLTGVLTGTSASFTAAVVAIQLAAQGVGSDTPEAGGNIQIVDAYGSPTDGWMLQPNADHSLGFWGRYAGAWHQPLRITYGGVIHHQASEIGSVGYGGSVTFKRGTDGAAAGYIGLEDNTSTKLIISAEDEINLPDFAGSGPCRALGVNAAGDVIVSTGTTTISANANLGDIPTTGVACSGAVILTLVGGADGVGWDLWGSDAYVLRVPSGVTLFGQSGVWSGSDFTPGALKAIRVVRLFEDLWILPNFA